MPRQRDNDKKAITKRESSCSIIKTPKHAAKKIFKNRYWVIFFKCIGVFLLGVIFGLIFFIFFKEVAVSLTEKYKFLQGFFGMSQYEQGAKYATVLGAILIGNLVSTVSFFILGYFRTLIPLSLVSGFLMIILLLAGAVKRQTAIPIEVLVLFSAESLYRCIALTSGEHLYQNRLLKKNPFILSIVVIVLLIIGSAFYEIYQIFGYIF